MSTGGSVKSVNRAATGAENRARPIAAGAASGGGSKKGLGARVRALRQAQTLTQVELAKHVGISASYLNLIEHNQRALTPRLLDAISHALSVEAGELSRDPEHDVVADLREAFTDPLLAAQGVTGAQLRDLAVGNPSLARSLLGLYRAYVDLRSSADSLASQIYDVQQLPDVTRSQLPSEEVSDFVQRRDNYFEDLEAAAQQLWYDARLSSEDIYRGLVRHLADRFGIRVDVHREPGALRRYDPARRVLVLSSELPPSSRTFQLAAQLGLLVASSRLDAHAADGELQSDASRRLCRVVLANYFAGAVVMPYRPMLEAARAERYDIELLGHRFRASFEQVCHRLTTLRRPGAEGVPFHMIRVDMAGNISKRFSASGIRFARFAGACPRWNVFNAFLTPGALRVQISAMPEGRPYFCVARTVQKGRGGYHAQQTIQAIGLGCEMRHAKELVYADGVDVDDLEGATPIGVTCRLCERRDCAQRAFPSIRDPLEIDENVRRMSPYASGD